ncbi:hypothetical protein QQ045_024723 [Rhodiola kirilowii]
MEAANALAVVTNNVDATDTVLRKQLKGKKKKGQTASLFKAALLTLFGRRKATKSLQAEVVVLGDANSWVVLVGCMRPMNLHDKDSTLMLDDDALDNVETKKSENMINDEETVLVKNEEEADVTTKLLTSSDAPLSSSSSESTGGDSRYASALNLQELDKGASSDEEEEEDNEQFDDTQGDAMIDMKAEMFIAQFYAQMRIQNIGSSS